MLSVVFPTTVLERREKASWTTAEGTAAIEAAEKKGICVALARSKDPFVLDTVEIGFISLVGNLNVAKGGLFIEEYGFPPFDRLLKGIPDLSMHYFLWGDSPPLAHNAEKGDYLLRNRMSSFIRRAGGTPPQHVDIIDAWPRDKSNEHPIERQNFDELGEMAAETKADFRAHLEKPGCLGFIALGRPAQAAAYKELKVLYGLELQPRTPPQRWRFCKIQRFTVGDRVYFLTCMPNPGATARGTPEVQTEFADQCFEACSTFNARLWTYMQEHGRPDAPASTV